MVERLQPSPPAGPGAPHPLGHRAHLAAPAGEQRGDPISLAELLHPQHHAGVTPQGHRRILRPPDGRAGHPNRLLCATSAPSTLGGRPLPPAGDEGSPACLRATPRSAVTPTRSTPPSTMWMARPVPRSRAPKAILVSRWPPTPTVVGSSPPPTGTAPSRCGRPKPAWPTPARPPPMSLAER